MSKNTEPAPAPSLAERLAAASRPERAIDVYLAAGLRSEYDALEARLKELGTERLNSTERREISERMQAIQDEMRASRVTFRLRALTRTQVAGLAKLADDDDAFNAAILREAIVEPEVDEASVAQLSETLAAGDFGRLVNAAQTLTFGETQVPFSHAASAASRG